MGPRGIPGPPGISIDESGSGEIDRPSRKGVPGPVGPKGQRGLAGPNGQAGVKGEKVSHMTYRRYIDL